MQGENQMGIDYIAQQEKYWSAKLSEDIEKSIFPYDFMSSVLAERVIKRFEFRIQEKFYSSLMKFVDENGKSDLDLYKVFIASIVLLLDKYAYSGNKDIIVGAPVPKSPDGSAQINTVVALRTFIKEEMTFTEFLKQVGQTVDEAYENKEFPFDVLLDRLHMLVSGGDFPMFDVGICMENLHDLESIRHININIMASFFRTTNHIEAVIEYNASLYKEASIKQISCHIINLLQTALNDPDVKINDIDVISHEERERLLKGFNQTDTDYPKAKTVHEIFEAQVKKTPENIAVVFDNQKLTYKQLNEKANQVARTLRKKGVKPNQFVGMMFERSLEMMIAMLAILKSGGAYLPIDPDYPDNRIIYMLKDSESRFLLTHGKFIMAVKFKGDIIDIMDESLYLEEKGNPSLVNNPTDLAYTIYTSGSTGKPKGVLIEHWSVLNLAYSQKEAFGIDETENILQFSSICFDASVEQIYISLLSGATLVLIRKEDLLDMEKFEKFIDQQELTHIHAVPSFVSSITIKKYKKLKRMIAGGDICPLSLVQQWIKYNDFCNEYGPTETTVTSIQLFLKRTQDTVEAMSIGRALNNTYLYVLNEYLRPVPIGVSGELYIGGHGVARGYLNRPELTAERFISDPFRTQGMMYRTGDLVRWLHDGNMEFLGRIDFQVKIRGFRIETGEIENKLLGLNEIKKAVVIARDDRGGEQYLCAYIISDERLDMTIIRAKLSKDIPDYMVPSYFIQLEELPLNPSGKVDRKKLPAPDLSEKGNDYLEPRNEIEKKLLGIWSEILHLEKKYISITDNFFKLGGHSLKAALMLSMIHKALNVKIKMSIIFEKPTIQELALYVGGVEESKYLAIPKADPLKEFYPQTSAQKRLFFMDQIEPESILYNIPIIDIPEEPIEKIQLERAVRDLIERQESLRTSFHMVDGNAMQKIHDFEDISPVFRVEFFQRSADDDLLYSDKPGMIGKTFEQVVSEFVRPFDLSMPPLLRIGLVDIAGSMRILMLDTHHIVSDGVSVVLMMDKLRKLYKEKELPPLRIQYKDFAEWVNSEERVNEVKKQETFWLEHFDGEIPLLNIPTDFPRPLQMNFNGDTLHFEIGLLETDTLNKMIQAEGETMFMVLFSAYNIMAAKLSGQEEIVIGTVTAGRNHVDLQNIIGMFVDTLAVRSFPANRKTFRQFLSEVKENTIKVFENQDYPFEELVKKVASRTDSSRNPLFDVVFNLENESDQTEYLLEALNIHKDIPYTFKVNKSKFDLTLFCVETTEGLQFNFEYKTSLFKQTTIERFATYFKQIIKGICCDIDQKISEIEIIPEAEKNIILYAFNSTNSPYPRNKTIHQLFEDQAEKNSNNTAVVGKGLGGVHRTQPITAGKVKNLENNPLYPEYDQELDYVELNAKSNQLAHVLREKGIIPDSLVAIMVEPSQEMIVGVMAILKAGGSFLPIKDDTPKERVDYIIKESNARFILSQKDLLKNDELNIESIFLDDPSIYKGNSENLEVVNKPEDMAYVIYTSGSTGKPKGVIIEHRSLVNLCFWHNRLYLVTARDHATKYAGFGFDASVWEIFPYLVVGASLYIVPEEIKLDIEALNHFFETNRISISFLPTQVCEQFMTINNTSLRVLLAGGDKLKSFVRKPYYLFNNYGPTEATVVATCFNVNEMSVNIPIGKPLFNTQNYIVDKAGHLQPIGVPGELYIGGDSVSRGYINKPEQTHDSFMRNPFPSPLPTVKSPRIYRSGDLARWLPDGNIEFWGRNDYQVKIRGFRIELGEIESQLLHLDEIKEAVVIARDDGPNSQKYLCAYLVPLEQVLVEDKFIENVKMKISGNLPDYMIPAFFVILEAIPLTANGKIDTRALPTPETPTAAKYAAPTNEIQETLAGTWAEVLGMEKVGIDDNFFDIGGDSIKTIMISAKLLRRKLNINVNDFFSYPTVRKLALQVQSVKREIKQGPVFGDVDLTPILNWFSERDFREKSHFYNYVTQIWQKSRFNTAILKKLFNKILEHHDALRIVFDFDKKKALNRNVNEGALFDFFSYDMTQKEYTMNSLDGISWSEWQKRTADFEKRIILKNSDKIIHRGHNAGSISGYQEMIDKISCGFDIGNGPMVRLALFRFADCDLLHIYIHHAVVDGISWRILAEDLNEGYIRLSEGNEMELPEKTDSFKDWAAKQKEYASSSHALAELDYWRAIEETAIKALPKDKYGVGNQVEFISDIPADDLKTRRVKNQNVINITLGNSEDEKKSYKDKFKDVNWIYNTEINDILLTALGLAVKECFGNDKVLINLEAHGREPIIEDINFSRTVGWFTTQYPLLLIIDGTSVTKLGHHIRTVKEILRRVPNKGIGYGILKYLTPEDKRGPSFKMQPEISFNYLGDLSGGDNDVIDGIFHSKLDSGIHPEFNGGYAVDIWGYETETTIDFHFQYNREEYPGQDEEYNGVKMSKRMVELAKRFKGILEKIIDFCAGQKAVIINKGKSAIEYHIEQDYMEYLKKVEAEEFLDLNEQRDHTNILMTGGTGFLGNHLLFELLANTDAELYLPIRGLDQNNAEERFKKKIFHYFGEQFWKANVSRFHVIKADLSEERLGMEEKIYNKLEEIIDAIVHPAANVKHSGSYEGLYRDNVLATENLLLLAASGRKKDFHNVSTISVGEGDIPGREYILFTEFCNDLPLQIDHIYLKSKYEAEKKVLEYRKKSVNGIIYRVGNLIFHTDTGKFQENIGDDFFYNIVRGAVKLEMFSEKMKKMVFDMSYINQVARAMVSLITKKNLRNQTYHLINPYTLSMPEMVNFLREMGFHLNDVDDEEKYLSQFEGDFEKEKIIELLKFHSWIFEGREGTRTEYRLDRTVKLLKAVGFEWPKPTKQLIEKMVSYCRDVGFL